MAVTSRSDPVTSRVFDLFGDPCLFRWSNRILIVSLLCIAALTLFPFRFDFSLGLPGNTSPLLLGPFHKRIDFLDSFLNVLLFVPFGFALSNQFRLRNRSGAATFALVFAAGAICSYLVELL